MPAELLDSTRVTYVDKDALTVEAALRDVHPASLRSAQPVRRMPTYAGQRNYPGLFWSATTGTQLHYESLLELDRLWLADADPDVCHITTQPFWLTGPDGSRVRRHVPDLMLWFRDDTVEIADVKPEQTARRREVADVFQWTGRACAAKGWGYSVWSGARPQEMARVRALAAGRRPQYLSPDRLHAARASLAAGASTIGEVAAAAGLPEALHLAWTGDMTVSDEGALERSSRVWARS